MDGISMTPIYQTISGEFSNHTNHPNRANRANRSEDKDSGVVSNRRDPPWRDQETAGPVRGRLAAGGVPLTGPGRNQVQNHPPVSAVSAVEGDDDR